MLLTGVPQSSILGPLFFQLSYKHIKEDISKHKIQRNTVEVERFIVDRRPERTPALALWHVGHLVNLVSFAGSTNVSLYLLYQRVLLLVEPLILAQT